MKKNIVICNTELSSPPGKIKLFPHILVKYLDKHGIPYNTISLTETGGDYIIQDKKTVIERKTVADFLGSWLYGSKKGKIRIEDQIDLAIRSYENCRIVLMIEDYYRCMLDYGRGCIWIPKYQSIKRHSFRQMGFSKRKVNPKSLTGKLSALESKYDELEILRCSGGKHALQWFIEELSDEKKDAKRKYIKVHRVKRKSEDITEQRLFFLEGLPNIGGATSKKLLEAYGTPMDAINDIDNWLTNQDLSRMSKPMVSDGKKVLGIDGASEDEEK